MRPKTVLGVGLIRDCTSAGGILMLVATLVGSCSKSPTQPPFEPVFPAKHGVPAWSATDVVAYVDFGIDCVRGDGSFEIDTSKAGVWLHDVQSSTNRRFLAIGDNPAWSHDGSLIALIQGRSIGVYASDGQARFTISTSGSSASPSWSHDDQYLVWEQPLEDPGIWIAQRDSLIPRRLLGTGGYPQCHPFQPALIYVRSVAGPGSSIVKHWFDASVPETTFAVSLDALTPTYSPDASQICFVARDGATAQRQLYVVKSSGGNPTRLTTSGGIEPSWSPDGLFLTYVRADPSSANSNLNTLCRYRLSTHEIAQLVSAWPSQCGP